MPYLLPLRLSDRAIPLYFTKELILMKNNDSFSLLFFGRIKVMQFF